MAENKGEGDMADNLATQTSADQATTASAKLKIQQQLQQQQEQQQQPATASGSTVIAAENITLQSLLNSVAPNSSIEGSTIRVIQVSNPGDLDTLGDKVWQVIPSSSNGEISIIAVSPNEGQGGGDTDISAHFPEGLPVIIPAPRPSVPPPPRKAPPPGCPPWALRLNDCETIGDSYRGWVESEVELDLLLTYHKQQTNSYWGTRQSPSGPQATRLMWKSQYVPFDGVPFINQGSRAIVMECQFGPRRKGRQNNSLKGPDSQKEFKQTCPARIYIKKVKKFPEFAVDVNQDKKTMKQMMDKTFQELKKRGRDWETLGHDRWYVQLPTDQAHEFHSTFVEPNNATFGEVEEPGPSRVHPRVALKIRELVAGGMREIYQVRKQLRKFVERDLFTSPDQIPEKHNLTYFPTVHDLQNHFHQALKDIETGVLPAVHVENVNVEVVTQQAQLPQDGLQIELTSWPSNSTSDDAHAETVTVTLTQNPGEDGQHVISRVETLMSDGSTQVSDSLTPETAQLLSKLHPSMFPAGSFLQVQDTAGQSADSDIKQSWTVNKDIVPASEGTVTEQEQQQPEEVTVIEQPQQQTEQITVAAGDGAGLEDVTYHIIENQRNEYVLEVVQPEDQTEESQENTGTVITETMEIQTSEDQC
ncbi:calcium-responsive transcription factor [Lingula anatina]|uniref:Calcium-responsive transcription factor n=1 Tax=Lingula anatina TaxID=7574 RepID=A0A1S3KEH7_LINAN|nr:calcium-responsive transcription factor [Lingula anatina]XP_013420860.1 calcium-responsive transcription factor [Lingula anatina]XP_013420861.1 calcium-responsive transcription factor [Lingula anatina]XP_013420862.1 calcium-responsive transcription factor [Lingula anatina]|eukprot:XP_013420859.1 calcium-responsive transcription factor [Lingula anatina]